MATPISGPGSDPYTIADQRRRPGRSFYTGRQDAAVSEAARSGSDPTTAEAWRVTI